MLFPPHPSRAPGIGALTMADLHNRGDATHNPYTRMLRDNRSAIWAVLAFSAIVNVLMLSGSVYMLQVYDRVLSSGSVPTLVALFTIVIVLYAFLGFFDAVRSRMLARVAVRMEQATGKAAFATWIKSGTGHAQKTKGQDQSPGPMQLLDMLRGFVASPAMMGLFDLPFVPLFVVVLFLIHPWLGFLVVAGSVVAALLALLNRKLNGDSIRRAMDMEAGDRDFAERLRRNGDVVVAMGMEHNLTAQWQTRRNDAMAAGQHGGNASEILGAASKAFRMMLQSAILTLGAFLVLRGEITAGMIIASSILSGRALAPVDQVIGQWQSIGRAGAAHAGLKEFFADHKAEPERIALPTPTGRISVRGLTKLAPGTAQGDRTRILTQVSFELAAGDGLGVIGNSSSGKSTLARLLTGAWLADNGEIRFDGATHDQWDPAILGRSIGYLPQAFDLLPGTIGANIARFDPAASDTDVIAAAQMAGVHELILKLPDGYATRVGERAGDTPLSGGQIQRLGLARAVYRSPAIVVLDEPNANLDATGDDALGAAITALRAAGSTVIVMAHRPSAIAAVNKLLVLHNGMVAQFGDKETVLGAAVAAPGTNPVTPFPVFTRSPSTKEAAPRPQAVQPNAAANCTAPITPPRQIPSLFGKRQASAQP